MNDYSIRDLFLAYEVRKHLKTKAICLELKKVCKLARDEVKDDQFKSICKKFIKLVSLGLYDDALKSVLLGYEYYLISESTKDYLANVGTVRV